MKMIAALAWCAAVAAVLVAGCQQVAEKGPSLGSWVGRIAGSYKGTIWSGRTQFPGTTELHLDQNRMLTGTYVFTEKGGTAVPGRLSGFRLVGLRKLLCRWEDKNGTGDFRMTFSDDLSRFDGLWDADGMEQKHAWNGAK